MGERQRECYMSRRSGKQHDPIRTAVPLAWETGLIKLNEETKTSLKTKHFMKGDTKQSKLCSLKEITFSDALTRLVQL